MLMCCNYCPKFVFCISATANRSVYEGLGKQALISSSCPSTEPPSSEQLLNAHILKKIRSRALMEGGEYFILTATEKDYSFPFFLGHKGQSSIHFVKLLQFCTNWTGHVRDLFLDMEMFLHFRFHCISLRKAIRYCPPVPKPP